MSTRPLVLVKIGSGKSLVRKETEIALGNKARSSSAESKTRLSLKNVVVKKSKENLIPREKNIIKTRQFGSRGKLQKLDLNIKEVNNTFYKRLNEIESKLYCFESNVHIPNGLISPVRVRN
ncbi:hypothetical protein SteCoe_36196 [Stentor coeruleus]|uniref:Uncharacterized protein n=1 Tax=Stentor coeruleus TaxID=5963 RepID=A0A1R2AQR5_9CILI|nr:hypothetical protein SteCoe_36196 [Stentor coeruleus]